MGDVVVAARVAGSAGCSGACGETPVNWSTSRSIASSPVSRIVPGPPEARSCGAASSDATAETVTPSSATRESLAVTASTRVADATSSRSAETGGGATGAPTAEVELGEYEPVLVEDAPTVAPADTSALVSPADSGGAGVVAGCVGSPLVGASPGSSVCVVTDSPESDGSGAVATAMGSLSTGDTAVSAGATSGAAVASGAGSAVGAGSTAGAASVTAASSPAAGPASGSTRFGPLTTSDMA